MAGQDITKALFGDGVAGETIGLPSPVLIPPGIVDVVIVEVAIDVVDDDIVVDFNVVVVVDVEDDVDGIVVDCDVVDRDVVEVVVEEALFIEYGDDVVEAAHLLEVPVTAWHSAMYEPAARPVHLNIALLPVQFFQVH